MYDQTRKVIPAMIRKVLMSFSLSEVPETLQPHVSGEAFPRPVTLNATGTGPGFGGPRIGQTLGESPPRFAEL